MERLKFPAPLTVCLNRQGSWNQTCSRGGARVLGSAVQFMISRLLVIFLSVFALGSLAPQAKAAFIGNYSLTNSTLTNDNADGFVSTPDNGQTIILTGGQTGSGVPGLTDLLFTAAGTGAVQFQYSYSALDFPGFDYAGYLLGNAFTQLADFDGASGIANFTVSQGQRFGFRVGTTDNTGEPGLLTVSNFTAPASDGGATVPEPATGPVLLFVAVTAIAARRMRRKFCV